MLCDRKRATGCACWGLSLHIIHYSYLFGWWFGTAANAQAPSSGAVDFAERWAGFLLPWCIPVTLVLLTLVLDAMWFAIC